MLNSYDEGWPRASHMPAVRSRHQCCAAQAFNGGSAQRYGLCSRLSNTSAQKPWRDTDSQCKRHCNRVSFAHASTSPYSHSVHGRPQTLIADITVSNKEYGCSLDLLAIGLTSLPSVRHSAIQQYENFDFVLGSLSLLLSMTITSNCARWSSARTVFNRVECIYPCTTYIHPQSLRYFGV